MQTPNTYTDTHGNIVCTLHMDPSVMNKHNICDECLDDAQEIEILTRSTNNRRNK
jgi:hypothetical protein